MCTWTLTSVGVTVLPARSTRTVPAGAGTSPLRPSATMRPSLTSSAPSSIGAEPSPAIRRAPSKRAGGAGRAGSDGPPASVKARGAKSVHRVGDHLEARMLTRTLEHTDLGLAVITTHVVDLLTSIGDWTGAA